MSVGWPDQSRDGDYIHFDGALPGQHSGVFRVRISDYCRRALSRKTFQAEYKSGIETAPTSSDLQRIGPDS